MSKVEDMLSKVGLGLPRIMLPNDKIDYTKWSVVACDQFTSDKKYWKDVESVAGDAPSTRRMILPEVYLEEIDKEAERDKINETMETYLNDGTLEACEPGFVYVERSTPHVKKRQGLVVALDLEMYDFQKGTNTPIRPTEATVLDRLPARIDVRRNAVLDLPHILVLFDDPQKKVFSLMEKNADSLETLYDFDLMKEGGHICGRLVKDEALLEELAGLFESLKANKPLLFAIGDGNHSLASAKEVWRELKEKGAPADHPARYALVEIENIHDDGLVFEPIHRVLFAMKDDSFFEGIKALPGAVAQEVASLEDIKAKMGEEGYIGLTWKGKYWLLNLKGDADELEAERLHAFLDPWLDANGITVDYIHGDEAYLELCSQEGNGGVYLPAIDKSEFFGLVDRKGSMPRKTFSLGEAEEKRYYLEAAKLIP
ncbi:MAG: DUF1015 domain-containing protein [Spirochaetales bacterium]|nr:DUF1015 domain-containing protein [Spirochaetales bacterium]